MYEFLAMLALFKKLLHNFTFGVLCLSIGVDIILGTIAIANSGKWVNVVKPVGFTAASFFLAPGLATMITLFCL